MTRVLLTGGSGFIAIRVLGLLIEGGHSVVTTVRSQEKANAIKAAHPNVPESQLSFVVVPDIAKPGAFDEAVVSNPPFEAVIHTASPFHFKAKDVKKELLEPAIIGTTGILEAIKKNAPTVKRVVITSSFAAILDKGKKPESGYVYSEADWNPITEEEAIADPVSGYLGSKTFAERAAWKFVEEEKPNFTLATINPPVVYGPVIPSLNSIALLNTSNELFWNLITGAVKGQDNLTATRFWVSVYDVAKAHVLAMEKEAAGSNRFFTLNGSTSTAEVAKIVADKFPEFKDKLPELTEGDLKGAAFGYNNSKSKEVLGLEYVDLEKTVIDSVNSLRPLLTAVNE